MRTPKTADEMYEELLLKEERVAQWENYGALDYHANNKFHRMRG